MQLKDIVKTLDEMTEEELHEHLRKVRHRRTVERPVAKAREAKVAKKESNKRMTALDKLLASLSPEDQALLLQNLEAGNEGGDGSGQG